jgi:hypothetical protein
MLVTVVKQSTSSACGLVNAEGRIGDGETTLLEGRVADQCRETRVIRVESLVVIGLVNAATNEVHSSNSEQSERHGASDGTTDDGSLVLLLLGLGNADASGLVEKPLLLADGSTRAGAVDVVLDATLRARVGARALAVASVELEWSSASVGASANAGIRVLSEGHVASVRASALAALSILNRLGARAS